MLLSAQLLFRLLTRKVNSLDAEVDALLEAKSGCVILQRQWHITDVSISGFSDGQEIPFEQSKEQFVGCIKPAYILNQFVAVAVFNREPNDGYKDFEACLKYNLPDGTHKDHKLKFKMERNWQPIEMFFVGMSPVAKDGVLSQANGTRVAAI